MGASSFFIENTRRTNLSSRSILLLSRLHLSSFVEIKDSDLIACKQFKYIQTENCNPHKTKPLTTDAKCYASSSIHKATQQALQELQNPKLSLVEQSQYFEKQIKV
ncbi:hypothetical protein C1H71_19090 [Iodobacter fluviatilis]|uniref:Uncharacterized protein n=1 Tax=Iodobacter fluviatilis TaxID=537 RepID=A0A7G3GD68_9NEIS|nr:hypothetical protein C1H71_19090 [Iodobacter fluviatilis]